MQTRYLVVKNSFPDVEITHKKTGAKVRVGTDEHGLIVFVSGLDQCSMEIATMSGSVNRNGHPVIRIKPVE